MKSFIAISALAATTLAQSPLFFGVISSRSGSDIHLLPMQARGNKIFLGGPGPTSFCPPGLPAGCPAGNSTVFTGGDETLSLGVVVPGGQQVYVAPDGSLSYTAPHTAAKPAGSVVTGWSLVQGNEFGTLTFEGGLYGCPAAEGQGFQVYGEINNVTLDPGCLGFDALTVNTTGAGAFQY